jgi:phage gpG-like protein
MPLAPVNIPPGIVKAATPLKVKGRYWDGNLIRWRAGKLQPVGGWTRISSTPLASVARIIFPWTLNNGDEYAAFGCDNQLYLLTDNLGFVNVTPPNFVGSAASAIGEYGAYDYGYTYYGLDTNPTYPRPPNLAFLPVFSWTIDNFGEDILAVASSDGRLLHWNYNEQFAEEVGRNTIVNIARVSNVATVTTANNHGFLAGDQVVIAGNSVGSLNGTYTVTSAPTYTTFTYANPGTNATGLGGTANSANTVPQNNQGVVVTAERYAVLIGCGGNPRRVAWSDTEDYTNWKFADPTSAAGFLDLDTRSKITMCANVREGILIWTEQEAWLMRYIGLPYIYQVEQIGYNCGLIAPRAFATFGGRCVWMSKDSFWIYDGGVAKPLPCEVGSYIFQNIDPYAGILYTNGSDNGLFPEVWFWYPSTGQLTPNKYVVYNYAEGWWSLGNMPRTAGCAAGVFQYPFTADNNNDVFQQEDGWTDDGLPITTSRYAETGSINIQNGNQITHVKQAITDSGYGYDSTALTFFSSFTPEGTETTSGPYNPRSSGYTDMRVTGRDFRVKIISTKDDPWSIGEMRLELSAGGRR